MKITHLHGRWVLDSRGDPTIEVDVGLWGGGFGRASVPSGKAVSGQEAVELRDGVRSFGGKGVSRALNGIEYIIKPVIVGMDAGDQEKIDATLCKLDGTEYKQRLGSNAILAVSLAVAKAAAQARDVPFYRYIAQLSGHRELRIPKPLINLVNGGLHATNGSDVQEIMLVPKNIHDIHTAIRMATEVHHQLRKLLSQSVYSLSYGDEGGLAPPDIPNARRILDMALAATKETGYEPGNHVDIALDIASSRLFRNRHYVFAQENVTRTNQELFAWYASLVESYPIVSIEDPFNHDAWHDWSLFTQHYPKLRVVADDLVATNERLLERAIQTHAANTVVVKPNRTGTLTETIRTVRLAQRHGWGVVVSHRAAETEDTTLAHLAVGLKADYIKIGSVTRGERTAKYNELLRISESLGTDLLASS